MQISTSKNHRFGERNLSSSCQARVDVRQEDKFILFNLIRRERERTRKQIVAATELAEMSVRLEFRRKLSNLLIILM